jgi:hypothetical protein
VNERTLELTGKIKARIANTQQIELSHDLKPLTITRSEHQIATPRVMSKIKSAVRWRTSLRSWPDFLYPSSRDSRSPGGKTRPLFCAIQCRITAAGHWGKTVDKKTLGTTMYEEAAKRVTMSTPSRQRFSFAYPLYLRHCLLRSVAGIKAGAPRWYT